MSEIEQALKQLRPRIEKVAPVQGYGVLVFSFFNILFGISLFFLDGQFNTDVAIVNPVFNYQFWGIGFFISGFLLSYGYHINSWSFMRQMLLIMIFSKMIWEIALLFRFFGQPGSSSIILLIWTLVTALQILLYLFFPSSGKGEGHV